MYVFFYFCLDITCGSEMLVQSEIIKILYIMYICICIYVYYVYMYDYFTHLQLYFGIAGHNINWEKLNLFIVRLFVRSLFHFLNQV